jgi:hypothetical protein
VGSSSLLGDHGTVLGTMHRVNLSKPKLNLSDSQVSHAGIFWDPSIGQGHFSLVQECYGVRDLVKDVENGQTLFGNINPESCSVNLGMLRAFIPSDTFATVSVNVASE